jgi:hypothetical protein
MRALFCGEAHETDTETVSIVTRMVTVLRAPTATPPGDASTPYPSPHTVRMIRINLMRIRIKLMRNSQTPPER